MSVLTGFMLHDRARGWPGGPSAEPKGSASRPSTGSSTSHGLQAGNCWVTSENEVGGRSTSGL